MTGGVSRKLPVVLTFARVSLKEDDLHITLPPFPSLSHAGYKMALRRALAKV